MSATAILLEISRSKPQQVQLFTGGFDPQVMLVNGKQREDAGSFPEGELVAFQNGLKQMGYAELSYEINGPGEYLKVFGRK